MPILNFTAKEIHILVQLLRLAEEDGILIDYAKKAEVVGLRNKLQNVKGV